MIKSEICYNIGRVLWFIGCPAMIGGIISAIVLWIAGNNTAAEFSALIAGSGIVISAIAAYPIIKYSGNFRD